MNLKPLSELQDGKYVIDKLLGQGGFGITYLARQKVTIRGSIGEIESQIDVAIKEFFMKDICNRDATTSYVSTPLEGSKELLKTYKGKFIKEARNIATFHNRHIIKVLDIFEENGTAYYVMEFINGVSLGEYIGKNGALSEDVALLYIRQIADALSYVHSVKMNHLDVKPANILRRSDSEVVLIDFGLSKRYDSSGAQTSSTPVGVSAGYAPLEQYNSGGVGSFSPATDIYSLGATLYKLVTGQTPPIASVVMEDGLPEMSNSISRQTRSVIEKSMCPIRKHRLQSIEEFLAIIDSPELGKEQKGVLDSEDTQLLQKIEPVLVSEPAFVPPPSKSMVRDISEQKGKKAPSLSSRLTKLSKTFLTANVALTFLMIIGFFLFPAYEWNRLTRYLINLTGGMYYTPGFMTSLLVIGSFVNLGLGVYILITGKVRPLVTVRRMSILIFATMFIAAYFMYKWESPAYGLYLLLIISLLIGCIGFFLLPSRKSIVRDISERKGAEVQSLPSKLTKPRKKLLIGNVALTFLMIIGSFLFPIFEMRTYLIDAVKAIDITPGFMVSLLVIGSFVNLGLGVYILITGKVRPLVTVRRMSILIFATMFIAAYFMYKWESPAYGLYLLLIISLLIGIVGFLLRPSRKSKFPEVR